VPPASVEQSVAHPTDDLGLPVAVPAEVARVVSLVPSLTEAIATTAPGLLIGATDWCSHPAELDVVRIRGTKNPRIEQIVALAPDLVVANEEENRPADLAALREAGLAVWTTNPHTVDEALRSLDRLLRVACRLDRPAWLDDADRAWAQLTDDPEPVRVLVPIWRRPWMALGRDTFAGDVLRRLGHVNVLAQHPDRYPRIDLADADAAELVVLPDEPYRFTADDGPEAFAGTPSALVSGRHLTWYGPSLAEAPARLAAELAARIAPPG
jgi:ABC-type Fe3+-hydroxamate transport system substrate-binding protein